MDTNILNLASMEPNPSGGDLGLEYGHEGLRLGRLRTQVGTSPEYKRLGPKYDY